MNPWKRWPGSERVNLRRDVDDELAFHIDMLARELESSGMAAADARDAAEHRFGTVPSVRDECLAIDRRRRRRLTISELLIMLRSDVRVAFRAIRRTPVFSATVVGTLAIGIGSAAAIFAVVNGILLEPLPYRNASQLVSLTHDMPAIGVRDVGITTGIYLTYRRLSHTMADFALYRPSESSTATSPEGEPNPERVTGTFITASLLPMLGVSPAIGRPITIADDSPKAPHVMLISDGFWRSRFGADPNVLGKVLTVYGDRRTIVGVMPHDFRFPDAKTQMWLPVAIDSTAAFLGNFTARGIARLRPGVSVDAAERELRSLLPRTVELFDAVSPGLTFDLILEQAHPRPVVVPLRDDVVGAAAGTLWVVAAAAMLVLLVTAANVANLLLVRGDARRHELSVRAALGAGERRVLVHFLTESLAISGMAAALGLAAAWFAVRMLVRSSHVQLPRITEVGMDGRTIAFTLLITLVVAVACSALPAIRFLRGGMFAGVRDGARGGTAGSARQRARSMLVSVQMALALVALVTSGLLVKSFERARAVRPGFNADGVATIWVSAPAARYPREADFVRFFARVTSAVSALPSVTAAGVTSRLPLGPTGDREPVLIEGEWDASKPIPPVQLYAAADAGFFRALQIPLIAGRLFDPIEGQRGLDALISSETARRIFNDSTGRSTIGRRFQMLPGGPFYTVLGVVGSARDTSLFHEPTMSVYMPESVNPDTIDSPISRTMAVVARTSGDVGTTTRAMRQAIRDLDPTVATFDARPMAAMVNASMARLTFTMIVLGAAAAVTLVLGLVGLYGVIAYIVALRTRELGLRIALGATPGAVSAMIARQGLTLAAGGAVIGALLVVLISRFLKSFLFDVAPLDPSTLGAAVAVLVACSLVATWFPARRAAGVDPAVTLRAE